MNRRFEKEGSTSAGVTMKRKCLITLLVAAALFPSAADTTHIVQKGETLYSLSRTYHTTVAEICKANNIADGVSVKAGQKIVIPGDQTESSSSSKTDGLADSQPEAKSDTKAGSMPAVRYIVQKGDTWYGIARRSNISVKELLALNTAESGGDLKVGQRINVPAPSSSANNSSSQSKSSSNTGNKTSANQDSRVSSSDTSDLPLPDIASSDPHNYSDKKGDSSLVWPVQSPSVTYVNGKVSGVKLSAKRNEPVTAIRAGTVMFSGMYRGFGNVVFIQSKTGHIYAYTGLGSVKVTKGDYIVFGDQIGTAGIDSYTEKPQVNLMVFQNGLPIDPAKAPRG